MLGFRLEVQALSRRNLLWSAVLTGSLVVGLKTLGVFQGADLALWDVWLRSRPNKPESTSVVVVEITEEEIQEFGSWPLPDATLAAAISRIEGDQPRAIGLISPESLSATPSLGTSSEDSSIRFASNPMSASKTGLNDTEADRPSNTDADDPSPNDAHFNAHLNLSSISTDADTDIATLALGRSASTPPLSVPRGTETDNPLFAELFRIPHVIVGLEEFNSDNVSPYIPSRQLGAIDVVLDFDGKLRRNLLSVRSRERLPQASFALRLSLLYLRHEGIEPHPLDSDRGWFQFGHQRIVPLPSSGGGYVQAQQRGYHIPFIYQSPLRHFPQVTLSQVLDGRVTVSYTHLRAHETHH